MNDRDGEPLAKVRRNLTSMFDDVPNGSESNDCSNAVPDLLQNDFDVDAFEETVGDDFVPSFLDEISIDALPETPSPSSDLAGAAVRDERSGQKRLSSQPPALVKRSEVHEESRKERLPANVVRLFERTLCVDGFDEESNLYSMCRAWIRREQFIRGDHTQKWFPYARRGLVFESYPKDTLVGMLWDKHSSGVFDNPPKGVGSDGSTPDKTPAKSKSSSPPPALAPDPNPDPALADHASADPPTDVVENEVVEGDNSGPKRSVLGIPLPAPYFLTQDKDPRIPDILPRDDEPGGSLLVVSPFKDEPGRLECVPEGDGTTPSAPELLQIHRNRWKRVKESWKVSDAANRSRFSYVLTALHRAKRGVIPNGSVDINENHTVVNEETI